MKTDVEHRGTTVALIMTAEDRNEWVQLIRLHRNLCTAGEDMDDCGHDQIDYFLDTGAMQLTIHTGTYHRPVGGDDAE